MSQSGSRPAGCCWAGCAWPYNAAAQAQRVNPRRARYMAVFNLSREDGGVPEVPIRWSGGLTWRRRRWRRRRWRRSGRGGLAALVALRASGRGRRGAYSSGAPDPALQRHSGSVLNGPFNSPGDKTLVHLLSQRLVLEDADRLGGFQEHFAARRRLAANCHQALIYADEGSAVLVFHRHFKDRAAHGNDGRRAGNIVGIGRGT